MLCSNLAARLSSTPRIGACDRAFTVVEAVVALFVLMLFAVTSTVTLNLFNDRAAKNRNAEAARALVENYVATVLASSSVPSQTGGSQTVNGLAVDPCTGIGGQAVTQPVALIVGRSASASNVVSGSLYWRVQNVGVTYGLNSATDLVQVDFVLQYTYRNVPYFYSVTTFKAAS